MPITAVTAEGASGSPSTILLAAWLHRALDAAVTIIADPAGTGIRGVRLSRTSGDIRLLRLGFTVAELTPPGQLTHRISLPRRTLQDCLGEELRRLNPDEAFGETVCSLGTFEELQESRVTLTGSVEPRRNRDRLSLVAVYGDRDATPVPFRALPPMVVPKRLFNDNPVPLLTLGLG